MLSTMARTYAEQLELAARVTEPAIRRAIEAVDLPPGSHGLDAGCGIGTHALWLAETTGGKVTGLDIDGDNLAVARKKAKRRSPADRIDFVEGSIFKLPFDDDSFDWSWCADALWPVVVPDPIAALQDISRVVKPGGAIAILFWTNQILLPGYPQLEARLNQAFATHTHYLKIGEPSRHHLRALGWLRSVGLQNPQAHSFLAEYQAPLADEIRESLGFCFSMFWDDLKTQMSEEDWAEYRRICSPESEDFILNSPDYYCALTYTIFHARVPGK
jgi:demethylmenaquinone methyltransferase/2-methoxy-6-polyprenyl-1,4-benzoquinol methylase